MPKILHTARYVGQPFRILQSVVPDGFTVKTLDEATYEQLLKEVSDADYFLVSGRLPIDEAVLDAAKKLKMIQRTGVGTEMLNLVEIKRRGIPVYVNAGVNARSVAEHTITLILTCLKRLTAVDGQVRKGVWKKQETGVSTHELYGKTVGLVGMGAVGRQVAGYLQCFGAKVLYTDLYRLDKEKESNLGLIYVPTFDELVSHVDILSFHCPLTVDNVKMLNIETLGKTKDGVIIVNTARGKLIDEKALYDALSSGKVAYVGLDVHEEEPMKENDPLKTLDNVILTPHIAGLSYETFHAMMKEAIDNIYAYEKKQFDTIQPRLLKL